MADTATPVHPEQRKDADRRRAVVDAVEGYDLTTSSAWGDLDVLSTHSYLDGVEVDPAGIIFDAGGRFRGLLNVYVLLEYGSNEEDGFRTSDSFIGYFNGHFGERDQPVIDEVTVDTSPFYEGETG